MRSLLCYVVPPTHSTQASSAFAEIKRVVFCMRERTWLRQSPIVHNVWKHTPYNVKIWFFWHCLEFMWKKISTVLIHFHVNIFLKPSRWIHMWMMNSRQIWFISILVWKALLYWLTWWKEKEQLTSTALKGLVILLGGYLFI